VSRDRREPSSLRRVSLPLQRVVNHEPGNSHERSIVGPQLRGPAIEATDRDLEIEDAGPAHAQVGSQLHEAGRKPGAGRELLHSCPPLSSCGKAYSRFYVNQGFGLGRRTFVSRELVVKWMNFIAFYGVTTLTSVATFEV
jgi:hypothetical protein